MLIRLPAPCLLLTHYVIQNLARLSSAKADLTLISATSTFVTWNQVAETGDGDNVTVLQKHPASSLASSRPLHYFSLSFPVFLKLLTWLQCSPLMPPDASVSVSKRLPLCVCMYVGRYTSQLFPKHSSVFPQVFLLLGGLT